MGRVVYLGIIVGLSAGGWALAEDAGPPTAPDAAPVKTTVRLTFSTRPRVRAAVYHGRKKLGVTPFSVQWKRNSGPVDVVVRAAGYLRVNTRAYTWRDEHLTVVMTPVSEKHTLFGYREELPPDAAPQPPPSDGGVPPATRVDAAH